jgi:hypothetical protein
MLAVAVMANGCSACTNKVTEQLVMVSFKMVRKVEVKFNQR